MPNLHQSNTSHLRRTSEPIQTIKPARWLQAAIAWLLVLTLAPLGGCHIEPAPAYACPHLDLQDANRPGKDPVPCPELVESEWFHAKRQLGVIVGSGERVEYELRRASADGPAEDLVLLVPILAGGRNLMSVVAQRIRAEGFDVAFCERAGAALSPPQRGIELDDLFRRTVLHQRLLLAWLRAQDEPPKRVHVLGLSMGGIVSTVLAAQEPGIDSAAICLAGADLARMVFVTSERRVHRWLRWRKDTDGFRNDSLHWELEQYLEHEPARFAPYVPSEKVLFVSAMMDTVVPRPHQQLLWEALGRPKRLDVPFGHYTSALALDRVVRATAEHFRAAAKTGPTENQTVTAPE
ncbi:MAG: alpha/beta hydrolase [Planctomycetota bacterium]